MALFMDGPPADGETIRGYESSVPEVAATEGINLDTKLCLAGSIIADRVIQFLLRNGSGSDAPARRYTGVSDVVVTPALKRWHAMVALELTYRDAYSHQNNDRYLDKMNQYLLEGERASADYFRLGVGLVRKPVQQGGTITPNDVDGTPYFACVTNVNLAGMEGAPGPTIPLNLNTGVQISCPAVCGGAYPYWNLYLGSDARRLALQNSAPLGADVNWVFTGTLAPGRAPGIGQAPDYFVAITQGFLRG